MLVGAPGGLWPMTGLQRRVGTRRKGPFRPTPAGHSAGGCGGQPHALPCPVDAWAHPVPSWVLSLSFHEDLRGDEVHLQGADSSPAQWAEALPASCFSSVALAPVAPSPLPGFCGVSALTTWSAELLTLGIYGNRPRRAHWRRNTGAGSGWAVSALSGMGLPT